MSSSQYRAGNGTTQAHLSRVAEVSDQLSRSRAGAAAARQSRTIGARGTHTAVGSLQARAQGTNRTRTK